MDCSKKIEDNICRFIFFGQDKDFYKKKAHSLSEEVDYFGWDFDGETEPTTVYEEETEYDLSPFTIEELRKNYSVIAKSINARVANKNPLFNNLEEERKMLPIDRIRVAYQKQCEAEYNFILLYRFLKKSNQLENEYDFIKIRQGFISDVLGTIPESFISSNTFYFKGSDIGIESLSNCVFYNNGDYEAPFGKKFSVAGMENISNLNEKNMAFIQLKKRMREYSVEYLVNLLNNSDNMLSNYQQLQSLTVKKDLNLSILENDLYTKLQSLIASKNILLSSGIAQEVIEEKIGKIEFYFESLRHSSVINEEEQKARDVDFLYDVFGDLEEVRQICEQHDGYVFTEEEWQQKFTNAQYILQVFDKLNIKQESLQSVLDHIFSSNYSNSEYITNDSKKR